MTTTLHCAQRYPTMQGDGKAAIDTQPQAGPYWSLMFEVSESKLKAVNNEVEDFAGGRWAGIVRECVQGALNTQLIQANNQIVSIYHRCASQALSCLQVCLTHSIAVRACALSASIWQAAWALCCDMVVQNASCCTACVSMQSTLAAMLPYNR